MSACEHRIQQDESEVLRSWSKSTDTTQFNNWTTSQTIITTTYLKYEKWKYSVCSQMFPVSVFLSYLIKITAELMYRVQFTAVVFRVENIWATVSAIL